MSYTSWPTLTELQDLAASASLPLPSVALQQSYLDTAINAFEEDTEWYPFLAKSSGGQGVVETRVFDPPTSRYEHTHNWAIRGGNLELFLRAGLLSSKHTLTTPAIVVVDPVVTVTGFTWQRGIQYWLRPTDAPYRATFGLGRPYTEVEFASAPFGLPECISVTGVWGRCLTLPPAAFNGVLGYALWQCIPGAAAERSGGTVYRMSGVTIERFAIAREAGAWAYEAGLWQSWYMTAVSGLTRSSLGV